MVSEGLSCDAICTSLMSSNIWDLFPPLAVEALVDLELLEECVPLCGVGLGYPVRLVARC